MEWQHSPVEGRAAIEVGDRWIDQPSTRLAAIVCLTYLLVILGAASISISPRDA